MSSVNKYVIYTNNQEIKDDGTCSNHVNEKEGSLMTNKIVKVMI